MEGRAYDERVRALEEELGIPTSDAQAMVDAEDLFESTAGPDSGSLLSSQD